MEITYPTQRRGENTIGLELEFVLMGYTMGTFATKLKIKNKL